MGYIIIFITYVDNHKGSQVMFLCFDGSETTYIVLHILCSSFDKSYFIMGLRIFLLLFTGATSRDAMSSLRFTEDSAGLHT